jgi:tRNA A37 methylthiotransferase MiaB
MKTLLFQLDGKIPNIALMRVAQHHRARGDEVRFRWTGSPRRELWDSPDVVYGSAIFEKSKPAIEQLLHEFPTAIIGGTGVDVASNLEAYGINTNTQDYSIYDGWRQSIGFTQRGCRLKCPFCVVPRKEGAVRSRRV